MSRRTSQGVEEESSRYRAPSYTAQVPTSIANQCTRTGKWTAPTQCRAATAQANNYLALEVPLASHDQPGRRRNRSAAIRSPMPVRLVSLGLPCSLDALLARSADPCANSPTLLGERGVAVNTSKMRVSAHDEATCTRCDLRCFKTSRLIVR